MQCKIQSAEFKIRDPSVAMRHLPYIREELIKIIWYQQSIFTKGDSNHFHIDAIIVSGGQYDVKMWNDVIYQFFILNFEF